MGLFFLLSVVSIRTVLAAEMLFYKKRIHSCIWIYTEGNKCHLSNLLSYYCMIYCLVGILSPCERTMILYQYTWSVNWVDIVLLEFVNDNNTCIILIFCHLVSSHIICARNCIVEVVGMSCSNARNVLTSLSPCCSISRVSVDHSANLREVTIDYQVSWSIRRRIEIALNHLTCLKVNHYHI